MKCYTSPGGDPMQAEMDGNEEEMKGCEQDSAATMKGKKQNREGAPEKAEDQRKWVEGANWNKDKSPERAPERK
jgi:hypothetical protein